MSIQIKTELHEGISPSCGGGEVRTHYEWTVGPRNLMRAIATLRRHRREMTEGYGNVGHRRSWLEVDGVELDEFDAHDIEHGDPPDTWRRRRTRTQYARETIATLQSLATED
jgi:hypothetical protein